jgi:Domain of unknown function (DUF4185)/Domain of unknown function (DUF5005)
MRLRCIHDNQRRLIVTAAVLFVPLLISLLLAPVACTRIPEAPPPRMAPEAIPDVAFNQLFTRFGNGWTGGDGTLSMGLPDGRTLWLFGDTFLGHVRSDYSRPLDSPLIRNCLVIQDGEKLVSRHGGTIRDPVAFLVPEDPDTWYWPGDGAVWGNHAWIFFHRFRQVTPGMWGWAWDGTVIATLSLPDLVIERVTPVADDHGVAFGAALLEMDSWVYIFGTEQRGVIKYLHVARAAPDGLEGTWDHWTGQGWSAEAGASRATLEGVSSQFGVVRLGKKVGLVTMDERQPFSDRVVVYFAEAPTGPWQGPTEIYRAPEADTAVVAYNPFVHPQFSSRNGHLISYNINHVHDPDTLYDNAGLYRPRFIRVDLNRLAVQVPNGID